MKVSYFPGCTLKNKARDLDRQARESALALGVELEELDAWQCCGGVFSTASDEIASKLSCVRALSAAAKLDRTLVTVCSACHNVIKQTNAAMRGDETFASRVNSYIAPDAPYHGETRVLHFLELLRDEIGWDRVREAVKKPLTGRKIGAYYGCLLLRPGKTMDMDDPENPQIMEDLIRAVGAQSVVYPMRNECCGGYMTLEDPALSEKKSRAVLDSAKGHGAELLVTACPLCRYNLEKNGDGGVPVVYFTQLLAEALGLEEEEK